ncbi:MAG TPA: response regulator [Thermoanaerobaculia bacterium]|nr:response regulator [Thermoanaerobaculia bacterium]
MPNKAVEQSSVVRFDLAIQRNHIFVYSLSFLLGLAGGALGVYPVRRDLAVLVLVISCVSAGTLYALYKRGVNRRYLNPVWMTVDVICATLGVYATGGIISPWYVWYGAASSAAAFASGKTAAYAVSIANAASYIGLLLLMGQATFTNDVLLLAFTRMLFVFGASYFFLVGIANLQQKRLRIRQLEAAESRKVEELTRLTEELAEANQRSKEADRLKSQFLATMSHELRTPMNSIIGFSEILSERLEGRVEPKHLGFIRHIHTSGQHLLGIINDILDLSKIEAGKREIFPELFSVGPAIESVAQVMRGMDKRNAQIVIEVEPDLPQIETDHAKFKQVLFNLLSNAVKFSPEGKAVRVRAALHDGNITVSVRDEGIGIDPAHHAMIFEEFRQVDSSARREFGGTGLGLALVKKFVELQGGAVTVDSAPGAGSTFSFTLPVRSHAAVVSRAPEIQSKAARVLVIEDDPNAYELIASALSSAGFLSVRARHADEALRLARESQPVAITLELVLPGVDGWELLKRLKNDPATRHLPVVIISMVENRDLGIALGADDYFVKPVDRERLLDRLRAISSRAANGRSKLLVIDDDAAVHALLDEDLSSLGFAIDNAYSGEEGLRAAVSATPDVIVLDLMMPNMSGFEVADSLKEDPRTANIPIVVLTSKEISTDDRALLHAKVKGFVNKGSSAREQLVRELRRVTAPAPPAPRV